MLELVKILAPILTFVLSPLLVPAAVSVAGYLSDRRKSAAQAPEPRSGTLDHRPARVVPNRVNGVYIVKPAHPRPSRLLGYSLAQQDSPPE